MINETETRTSDEPVSSTKKPDRTTAYIAAGFLAILALLIVLNMN